MNPEVLAKHRRSNGAQSLLLLLTLATVLFAIAHTLFGGIAGWIAVGIAVALFFITPAVSPALVLRAYRAKELPPERFPQYNGMVAALAERARLPRPPKLYYLPSDVMNAFTVGRSEQAVIAVSDGLLRRLDFAELAAVLAHEVAHIQNRDVHLMGFADIAGRLVGSLSRLGQFLLFLNLPLMLLGQAHIPWLTVGLLFAAPLLTGLAQLALSRTREFAADQDAAELLGDPRPLASALQKIEHQSRSMLEKMFGGRRGLPEPSLLRTHPHTHERIERLQSMRPMDTPVLDRLARSPVQGLTPQPIRPRWHRTATWF